jgi:hypothetical protein
MGRSLERFSMHSTKHLVVALIGAKYQMGQKLVGTMTVTI